MLIASIFGGAIGIGAVVLLLYFFSGVDTVAAFSIELGVRGLESQFFSGPGHTLEVLAILLGVVLILTSLGANAGGCRSIAPLVFGGIGAVAEIVYVNNKYGRIPLVAVWKELGGSVVTGLILSMAFIILATLVGVVIANGIWQKQ